MKTLFDMKIIPSKYVHTTTGLLQKLDQIDKLPSRQKLKGASRPNENREVFLYDHFAGDNSSLNSWLDLDFYLFF